MLGSVMKLQVGVKALLCNAHGEYLFLHRAKPLQTGETACWDIPGGRMAVDEDLSLNEALRREILEETGMQMRGTPKLLAAQDILHPEADLHVIRLTYLAVADGEPNLSDEHSGFAWHAPAEAQKLETDRYLKAVLSEITQS